MKKILVTLCTLIALITTLTACSSRPEDADNYNFILPTEDKKITGCDIYYNIGANMLDYINIDSKKYSDIVYAAIGVARSTWVDGNNKFYLVSDKTQESDIDFVKNSLVDETQYVSSTYNILSPALEKVNPERVSIVITDLQTDLNDYAKVSELIVKNVLAKDLSAGFIGVQIDVDEDTARTFFILVIADGDNLSKYISNFKGNPSVISYSGELHDVQTDTVNMINYQIVANKSGIKNLIYDKIEYVENGFYVGADGNLDVKETKGSFSKLRDDYDESQMYTECEGTVNFSPNTQRLVNIRESKENRKLNIKPVYLGAKSLVYESKNSNGAPVAGKLKLNVPFNVINGVKLSKIQCDVSTEIYAATSGKFKSCKSDDIIVTLADAATPEQGRWRVDDKTNSVILNIFVKNAGKLPIDNGVVKLDITFKQNDTIESVSNWVRDWDSRCCRNLMNLFDSIYTYQKDANVAENKLTIYLGTGDAKFTKRAEQMSGNEKMKTEETTNE